MLLPGAERGPPEWKGRDAVLGDRHCRSFGLAGRQLDLMVFLDMGSGSLEDIDNRIQELG